MEHHKLAIHVSSADPGHFGPVLSNNAHDAYLGEFNGEGEVWRLVRCNDGTAAYWLECERNGFEHCLGHWEGNLAMTGNRDIGEKWNVIEENHADGQPLVSLKCTGHDHDLYLCHDAGSNQLMLLDRSEAGPHNSMWRLGFHQPMPAQMPHHN